jgi:hypothetical protein
MYAFSSPGFWLRLFREFRCPYCGSPDGYVSRPRTRFERYGLSFLLLRPARCGDCYRRSYFPRRVPLEPRPKAPNFDPRRMPASTLAAQGKGSHKEMTSDRGSDQRIA